VRRRPLLVLLLACALAPAGLLVTATATLATTSDRQQNPLNDQGSSPNYRSLITAISPKVPGLAIQVLQFSDRLQLRNGTGRPVSIEGYEGEPYARVQANGTVEVNKHSPAYYLNQSFYGNVTVPSFATAKATPQWSVVDRTGQFEWHDHRIHWMSPVLPPQVRDKGKRTLIFAWHVPIAVAGQHGTVAGQLFWTPESSSAPVAAIVIGGAIVVLGLLFVLATRRRGTPRRGRSGDDDGVSGEPPTVKAGTREAW
jgi:hypothetical protein